MRMRKIEIDKKLNDKNSIVQIMKVKFLRKNDVWNTFWKYKI